MKKLDFSLKKNNSDRELPDLHDINSEKQFKSLKSLDLNTNEMMCIECYENLKKFHQIEDWNEINDIINKFYLKSDPKKLLFSNIEDSDSLEYKIEMNNDIKGNLSMHGKCIIY